MKRLLGSLFLSLRYRIHYQGVENIEGKGSVLILGNWTSQLDPLITILGVKQSVTPLIYENTVSASWLRNLMAKVFNAFFLPPYTDRGRSFYSKRLLMGLKKAPLKGSLLVYPKGKMSPLLYEIFQVEQKRVIFVHIKGMGGSDFTDKPMDWKGYLLLILKNLVFFMPKRQVEVIFSESPPDFPFAESSEQMNRYVLGQLSKTRDHAIPHIPYCFWQAKENVVDKRQEVTESVYKELERLSFHPMTKIAPEMDLYEDLGLDSLDVTELIVFLEHRFQKKGHFFDLRTVEDVIATAIENKGGDRGSRMRQAGLEAPHKAWKDITKRASIMFPIGETLPELFLQSCDRLGSALASVDPIEVLSYTRLKTLVIGVVGFCQKLPGKHVGILLPSTNDFNVVTLALMMAGKIPAPLNWTLGLSHLEEALELGEIQVVLSSAPILDTLPFDLSDVLAEKIMLIEELKEKLTVKDRQVALQIARGDAASVIRDLNLGARKGDDIAVLLFTSGTEKKPKGVPLSHKNLIATQKAALKGVDFSPADVLLGILPPFHVFGFSLTHLFPLMIGCRVMLHPNILDLPAIASQIEKWEASVICTAPTFLRALLSLATSEQLRSVRYFIVGAEKTPESLFEHVLPPQKVIEGYGMTECSPLLTLNRITSFRQGVGFPVEGVEIRLVDPTTYHPIPEGEVGVILARGENIFKGYLNGDRPFVQFNEKEWLITGDTGYLDASGALHLSARLTRTIKIGGEMISLPAIEKVLQQELKSDQVAVLAKEDEDGLIHLVLYCTLGVTLERINQILRQAGFSNLLRIKEIHILSQLPLTATGKINYPQLGKEMG